MIRVNLFFAFRHVHLTCTPFPAHSVSNFFNMQVHS